MRIILTAVAAAFCMGSLQAAEEQQPAFPKVGREYRVTTVPTSTDSVKLEHVPTNVVFLKWMGGSWYEVAFVEDQKIHRTNLNVALLFTM